MSSNNNSNNSSPSDEYERIKLLGEGSFATVELFKKKTSNEQVAIKLVKIKDHDDIVSIKNEIEILK